LETKQVNFGTLLLIPLAFLVKDVIATTALLSREPGITDTAAYYFALASLPGTLFVTTGYAMALNLLIGALTSVIFYVVFKLQARHRRIH
jgi:hypothetical protein